MNAKLPNSCVPINGHSLRGVDMMLRSMWEFADPIEITPETTVLTFPTHKLYNWPDEFLPENFPTGLEPGRYIVEVYQLTESVSVDRLVELGGAQGKIMPGSLGLTKLCVKHAERLPDGALVSPHTVNQRYTKARKNGDSASFCLTAVRLRGDNFALALQHTAVECQEGSYVIYFRSAQAESTTGDRQN